jgi:hypothetical protein
MKMTHALSTALCLVPALCALGACGGQGEDSDHEGMRETDLTGPAPAVEAVSSELSASACGSGYKLVGVIPLVKNVSGPVSVPNPPRGELEVFYNASSGKNCLVTQALGPLYGVSKRMVVRACTTPFGDPLGPFRCPDSFDGGNYKYYAGPIYIKAPHQCIYYAGFIYDPNGKDTWVTATDHGFCG